MAPLDSNEPPAPFSFCRWVCRRALDELFDVTVSGEEHVPATGPCIVAANHVSFLDPPAVVIASARNAFSLARRTLSRRGIWHWLFRRMHTIAIDRDGGNDLSAIRESVQLLKNGNALVLFPEGSRSADGTIKKAKRGVGLLASMARVPIVPARIFGSFEAWGRGMRFPKFFSPLHVSFGPAIAVEEFETGGGGEADRRQAIVDLVMERIAAIGTKRH